MEKASRTLTLSTHIQSTRQHGVKYMAFVIFTVLSSRPLIYTGAASIKNTDMRNKRLLIQKKKNPLEDRNHQTFLIFFCFLQLNLEKIKVWWWGREKGGNSRRTHAHTRFFMHRHSHIRTNKNVALEKFFFAQNIHHLHRGRKKMKILTVFLLPSYLKCTKEDEGHKNRKKNMTGRRFLLKFSFRVVS